MRSVWLGVLVAACGGSTSAPPVMVPPPQVSAVIATPIAGPATPATPAQVFAPASPAPSFADPDRRAKLAAAFPAIDKAMAAELAAQGLPGVSVGIVIDGELAYAKGFGVVDPATETVPDADTVYRIGSITKSFTGLALLSLRDRGALALDDTLAKWIPEASKLVYPARDAPPITLRHLTQHTSGLPRMGPFPPETDPDEATVVGSLARTALERAPGLESVYSNLGFSLLGIVASHAAHQPLHDLIEARIFKPLGMTSTGWDPSTVPAGHLAPAFTKGPRAGAVPPARLGAADAAGGIYSSVRDMARYAAFLLAAYPPRDDDDRGPIRRATIREAHLSGFALEPQAKLAVNPRPGEPLVEVDAAAYGFGWVHDQGCTALDQVWHNGAIDSYRAELKLRTASGVGVIVLTNFGDANTDAFARRIIDQLAATGAMKPREAVVSPAVTPVMTKWLEVYNAFDEAKLASILTRSVDPAEPAELAGYKALHGTCTSFRLVKTGATGSASFAFTCEHGTFELDVNLAAGGKISGFVGRSISVTPPAKVGKLFATAVALHMNPTWNPAAYAEVFPNKQIPEAQARAVAASLHAQFGTCKAGAFGHELFSWTLDLVCAKGGPLVLAIQLKDDELIGIRFRSPQSATPSRCPTR